MHACLVSHVQLFVTPRTVAHQAPLSMGISRQKYWSGLPFPTLGHLPDPGVKPMSFVSPVLAGGFFTTEPPGKPHLSEGYVVIFGCVHMKMSPFLTCVFFVFLCVCVCVFLTSEEYLSVLAKVSRKQCNLSYTQQ